MTLKIMNEMIEVAENPAFDKEFPAFISWQLDASTEIVLGLLVCYMNIPTVNRRRENTCLRLIDECFKRLRCRLDRRGQRATELLDRIQNIFSNISNTGNYHKLSELTALIHKYHLPIDSKMSEKNFFDNAVTSLERYDLEL